MGDSVRIYEVNPSWFRTLHYKLYIRAEAIIPKTPAVQEQEKMQLFQLLYPLPETNKQAVLRDFVLSNSDSTKADPDKYLIQQDALTSLAAPPPGGPAAANQPLPATQSPANSGAGLHPGA